MSKIIEKKNNLARMEKKEESQFYKKESSLIFFILNMQNWYILAILRQNSWALKLQTEAGTYNISNG